MQANFTSHLQLRRLNKRWVYEIPIQSAYIDILDDRYDVAEIQCNVELDGDASDFTTDIVAVMTNGEIMVRECVSRKILTRPLTMKWLEISQTYWYHRGVKEWGLVVDETTEE